MSKTGMATREQIESVVPRIYEIENARPAHSVDETIAAIDSVMAREVEGWSNSEHRPRTGPAPIMGQMMAFLIVLAGIGAARLVAGMLVKVSATAPG